MMSEIQFYGEHFFKTGLIEAEYGRMLGYAFDSRLDSDYDVVFIAGRTLADELFRGAQRFVVRVERYLRQADVL